MENAHLAVKVRRMRRAAILDLRGEIDGFAEKILAAAYAEAERAGPESVLLNFARVHYINSTGIALIVGLLAKTRATHRCLFAYGLSEHYVEIFEVTRLSDFVRIVGDEEQALAEANQIVSGQRADA